MAATIIERLAIIIAIEAGLNLTPLRLLAFRLTEQ